MVADFVDVPVALASAIDASLNAAAQHVVLFGDGILDWIRRGRLRVTGCLGSRRGGGPRSARRHRRRSGARRGSAQQPRDQILAPFASCDKSMDPDFEPWMTAGGAAILETLQPRLAARYIEMERFKGGVVEPQRMLRLGVEQERVLSCYWEAIDRAGHRDLSRFALVAAEHLLHPGVEIQQWIGQLQIGSVPRLADRSAVYQASLAFLKQLRRLADWNRQATGTAYYDDNYSSSQFWKTQWEAFQGEASASMAERMIRAGDPISA